MTKIISGILIACLLIALYFVYYKPTDRITPIQREYDSQTILNKGENLFLHYCAHCHGTQGGGDGYNAEFLDKEPADLSDHEFISKKKDDQIFRVIKKGGIGVRKSSFMPVFGNTLSEEEIWFLVAYIRKLSGAKANEFKMPKKVKYIRPLAERLTHSKVDEYLKKIKNEERDEYIEEGERLFKKKKSCFACHQVGDEGGQVGPDLTRSGFMYKPDWLISWMKNPQRVKPNTKMPNLGLKVDEAAKISMYLTSLYEPEVDEAEKNSPYLEKEGDGKAGKKLFFDSEGKATCSKCHRVNKKGGNVGPDLSIISSARTLPFILESILNPSKVITVGYQSILVLTKEGKFLTGIKINEDDSSLEIVNKEGEAVHIPKESIKKFKVQKISMMPGNFRDLLTVTEVQDLLAFLKTLEMDW